CYRDAMRAAPQQARAADLSREWLYVNGLGDIASGTASGPRVRTAHSELRVRGDSGERVPLVLALDARVTVDGHTIELCVRPPDPRSPAHARATIEAFEQYPLPRWTYRAGEALLEKRLFLLRDQHALVASFRHLEGPPLTIAVSVVLATGASFEEAPPAPD